MRSPGRQGRPAPVGRAPLLLPPPAWRSRGPWLRHRPAPAPWPGPRGRPRVRPRPVPVPGPPELTSAARPADAATEGCPCAASLSSPRSRSSAAPACPACSLATAAAGTAACHSAATPSASARRSASSASSRAASSRAACAAAASPSSRAASAARPATSHPSASASSYAAALASSACSSSACLRSDSATSRRSAGLPDLVGGDHRLTRLGGLGVRGGAAHRALTTLGEPCRQFGRHAGQPGLHQPLMLIHRMLMGLDRGLCRGGTFRQQRGQPGQPLRGVALLFHGSEPLLYRAPARRQRPAPR